MVNLPLTSRYRGSVYKLPTASRYSYQYHPVGRLLQATSRLGVETFSIDLVGNLLDQKTQELNRPLEADPRGRQARCP